ncbi:SspB family protein [Pararhodospirillum oryzae]|uniref:Stringent starvation protein B n=1 Tax=Pararhodospirillum oryzae TaxID=478448 RepID=A0A512H648_9PROT|nr:ClpXP protease specificity-enhancing factor SspB [Pararhodospirillum oryzae]GEO80949.1 hypothetical protein ROR02_10800 [Pararhodospirillum oryzae]
MEDRITHFAYDQMVESALKGVVREALDVTARQGLPGAHHFYITFRTNYPGVQLAPRLKSQHPEAMTIVLQNQFWDLVVEPDHFEVSLSFGGRRERLVIPFRAVSTFADPHATFSLQFSVPGGPAASEVPENGVGDDDTLPEGALLTPGLVFTDEAPGDATPPLASTPAEGSPGNIITLDRFRKKP